MADALASGASGSNTVWVQVPSPAFFFQTLNLFSGSFFICQIILKKKLKVLNYYINCIIINLSDWFISMR